MTHEEIIIELTKDLYTVREAYKEEQEEVKKYRKYWLDEILKVEKLENEISTFKTVKEA